jgi:hypothetical protein
MGMKAFFLVIISFFVYSIGRSQGTVIDTHPSSQIFAIDYQSGQEVQAAGDQAILFKDAFINLVSATAQSRQILRMSQGRKTATIKQIDPQKLNGYQLTWQSMFMGQSRVLCTFYYNIDENALYYYDQGLSNWTKVEIEGNNLSNLDNCRAYAKFNLPQQGLPDLSVNGSNPQAVPDLSVNNSNNDSQARADMENGLDTLSDEEISASVEPPPLPVYDQPACPVDGYLWQPGYWAFSVRVHDYYWVPGVWVAPPRPGYLWTPCYWEFTGGYYHYHMGYWGLHVGFYGGINYGFGYVGVGFVGGEWHGGVYRYNTAVVHVNTTVVHNTYINNTVINNTTVVNRASFNGQGGVVARPTAQEQTAMHEQHIRPTSEQMVHQQAAVNNKSQFAAENKGRPAMATMAKVNPVALNPRANNAATTNGNRTPGNQAGVKPNNRSFNNNNNQFNRGQQGQGGRQQKQQKPAKQPKQQKQRGKQKE